LCTVLVVASYHLTPLAVSEHLFGMHIFNLTSSIALQCAVYQSSASDKLFDYATTSSMV
jgi:hypothetical protein